MIRKAEEKDINAIMKIIKKIKEEMKVLGNPQWDEAYPLEKDFLLDIHHDALYVYEIEKEIVAFVCIMPDFDDEYDLVKLSTDESAYIIHRMGIKTEYRRRGIATEFMRYAEMIAINNKTFLLKADTEESNVKMNQLFLKMGYSFVTKFHWLDCSGTFNYYEKRIGGEKNV